MRTFLLVLSLFLLIESIYLGYVTQQSLPKFDVGQCVEMPNEGTEDFGTFVVTGVTKDIYRVTIQYRNSFSPTTTLQTSTQRDRSLVDKYGKLIDCSEYGKEFRSNP